MSRMLLEQFVYILFFSILKFVFVHTLLKILSVLNTFNNFMNVCRSGGAVG